MCKACLCLCVLWITYLHAQETIDHASLGGRVADPSGGAVQNARVTARQVETNQSSSTTTDRDGRFRFSYLRIGAYEVKVGNPGFSDALRTLT